MTTTKFIVRGASRTDVVRRLLYKTRNADTLARMHQRQANLRTQTQPTHYPLDENVFENLTGMNSVGMDLGEDTDDESDNEIPETPVWVDLVEEPPDEIDRLIAEDREKHRQRAQDFDWATLLQALLAEYMKLRIETNNWASENCYHPFLSCSLLCRKKQKKARLVDLVDIRGQRRQLVEFCKCTLDGVRLLQLGYLAGSPDKPQTAFSLPLLIFHNSLWSYCHFGALPFTMALNHWLEPRSRRLCARKRKHARDLRKPFSAAIDLYRRLEEKRQETVIAAIKLSPLEVLAFLSCPSCFGPEPPNSAAYPLITRARLIVCLDANFQQRHQMKAGRKTNVIQTPRIFLSQSHLDSVSQHIREQEAQGMAPQQADRCTEAHKAADDKRNESTWKGCDDTGIMGCCCRHDAGIYFANIYKSGEQRLYPMAIIQTLLSVIEPKRQVGILYDIGCTMDKYIDRRHLIPEYRSQITFGTSVFHAYAHNWLCQLEFHPRFNKGWGLSDGEGLERMWSYLSPLVSPLRYATRNHRLAAISHRLKHHNERGIQQLPLWLRRKFTKALNRRRQTQAVLSHLISQHNPHRSGRNYSVRFFNKQWKKQRNFHADDTQSEADRRRRLVEFYVREATLEHMRTRLRSPEIFLATVEEVDELMNSIVAESARLSDQLVELTGAGLLGTGIGTEWRSSFLVAGVDIITNDPSTPPDHLDELVLGDILRVDKLLLIKRELTRSTLEHANLVDEWSDNVSWLWKRCQPTGNEAHFQQWFALVERAYQLRVDALPYVDDVDDWIEEAVLDEEHDDGDDAHEDMISFVKGNRPASVHEDEVLANEDHVGNGQRSAHNEDPVLANEVHFADRRVRGE
ncbi:hypothetical protein MJO29_000033 [Puccinia striiformis f. sp. tritici]|nr:hypothetical protein MJO29_000033 [Puccinia striiformis f. sp. tritici]